MDVIKFQQLKDKYRLHIQSKSRWDSKQKIYTLFEDDVVNMVQTLLISNLEKDDEIKNLKQKIEELERKKQRK